MAGVTFPELGLPIKATYEDDGSARSKFLAAIDDISKAGKDRFRRNFSEVGSIIEKTVGGIRGGSFKFEFDLPGMRQAAAQADHQLQKLQAMRDAAVNLARTTGDTSRETSEYITVLRSQTVEAERAAASANAQVQSHTRLQAAINVETAANEGLAASYRALYLERARAENTQHRAQQDIGNLVTPVLMGRRAVDNGAGFEALAAMEKYAQQAEQVRQSLDPAYAAQTRYNSEMAKTRTLVSAGALSLDEYCAKLRMERQMLDQASAAGARHNAVNGAQRAGMSQLSMQIGDMATMYSLGASAQQIFASQSSQVIQAVSLMSGGTSKFATFMLGPWGTALTAGALVLTPLIGKLFDTSAASKAAEEAGKSLADRQLDIASFFDVATGKIKENSRALIENAKAQIYARSLEVDKEQRERTGKIGGIVSKSTARAAIGFEESVDQQGTVIREAVYSKPNADLVNILRTNKGNRDAIFAEVSKLSRTKSPAADEARQLSDLFAQSALSARESRELDAKLKSLESGTLDGSLLKPSAGRKGGRKDSGADDAKRLGEFAESAAEKVARLTEQFDRQPRAIDRAKQAGRELDAIYRDLSERKLLDPKAVGAIEKARAAIADFSTRPFQEMVAADRERYEIQGKAIEGRNLEAEMLERAIALQAKQGEVTDDQLGRIRQMVLAQRAMGVEQERQNAMRQAEGRIVDATRDNIRDGLSDIARGGGVRSLGELAKRQFGAIREDILDSFFESTLGPMFREQRDKALGYDLVKAASRDQATVISELSSALTRLRDAADQTAAGMSRSSASVLTGAGELGSVEAAFDSVFAPRIGKTAPTAPVIAPAVARGGANDNYDGPPITASLKPPREFMGDILTKVTDVFLDKNTATAIGKGFANGLSGNGPAYGLLAGGLINGGGNSPLGSAIGGALGEKLGTKVLAKGLESVAKGLGDFAGPLGSIAGGLIGGALGSLMTSTPRASATIGGGSNGKLEVVSSRGNSQSLLKASNKSAGEALDTLDKIAEALGATIDASAGTVSIGYRKGNARVDTTGSGVTKTSRGAVDFGEDTAAAIKFATLDLVHDGVLVGLRQGTRTLLMAATDLDKGIRDAVDFQSIFDRLKGIEDPVGSAIDGVNRDFVRLKKLAEQAGEGLVEAEKLYGLERAKAIEDAMDQAFGSLKSLRDDLMMGDGALSLRDRRSAALAAYSPLADRIRAGDTTANDKFATAAQALLDIERQISGSQGGYFDLRGEILGLTNGAIEKATAIADAAIGRDSPFSSSAVPAQDNASVVSAIQNQTDTLAGILTAQLSAMNQNMGTLIRQGDEATNDNNASILKQFTPGYW